MTTTYQFHTQLRQGEGYAARLDSFFRYRDFQVSAVGMNMQRRGIDRVFCRRTDGDLFTVEYKADSLAGKTGNAFIETISVDTTREPGWAYSSEATILVYLVVEPETIYWIAMARLRAQLPRWERHYATRQAQNEGYQTHGLLVPLWELERIAAAVW